MVIKTCPVDANGYFNLSAANLWHGAVASRAKIVIVETDPALPYVQGIENGLHESQVDYVIEGDGQPVPELPSPAPTDADRAVARLPGPSRCSSRRARWVSSRSDTEPAVAPSRPLVPVSASVISRRARVPGHAQPVADLPQPGPVAVSVGDLEGVQAVEGDGPQPGEPDAGRARLGQRPGHHAGQRLQRRRASRRRRSRSAFSDGRGRSRPASLPHTRI